VDVSWQGSRFTIYPLPKTESALEGSVGIRVPVGRGFSSEDDQIVRGPEG